MLGFFTFETHLNQDLSAVYNSGNWNSEGCPVPMGKTV